eukprot:gene8909-9646_t
MPPRKKSLSKFSNKAKTLYQKFASMTLGKGIQDLPIDLIQKILYEFILSSPYSTDRNIAGYQEMNFQYSSGKASLRAFLACNKQIRHEWGRRLNYYNLKKSHTNLFVKHEQFRQYLLGLIEEPRRQIGLYLHSAAVLPDEYIAQCNHVHHIFISPRMKFEQHQYALLDDVAILMAIAFLYVDDMFVFKYNQDLQLCSPQATCIDNTMSFERLERLTMYEAHTLTHITGGLPQLRYLRINTADRFVELSGIPTIKINQARSFTSIELFRNIPRVEFELSKVNDISCLTNVRDLHCPGNVAGWHAVQGTCERLTVYGDGLANLAGMTFTNLYYLKISGDIGDITPFNQVRELHLEHCPKITDLSPISVANGGKVQKFTAHYGAVNDFTPLKGIKDVALYSSAKQFEQLGNHYRLLLNGYNDMNTLPTIDNVKYITISSWFQFNTININVFNRFYSVKLCNCLYITSIPAISNLVELTLHEMLGMTEFDSKGFQSLKRLELQDCRFVTKITLRELLEHFAFEGYPGQNIEIKVKSKLQSMCLTGHTSLITIQYFTK